MTQNDISSGILKLRKRPFYFCAPEIKVILKNRDELATTTLKRQALKIIEAGIERVLPRAMRGTHHDRQHRNQCQRRDAVFTRAIALFCEA